MSETKSILFPVVHRGDESGAVILDSEGTVVAVLTPGIAGDFIATIMNSGIALIDSFGCDIRAVANALSKVADTVEEADMKATVN